MVEDLSQRYFVIGAPKCGTTTLAYWLEQTRSVFLTPEKEPHFYSSDYVQHWDPKAQTEAGYLDLFKGVSTKHQAVGEASTNYLWSRVAVRNILQDWPSAKFIVCIRDPSDMARSLHAHHVFHGHDDIQSFEEAWDAQDCRLENRRVPTWMKNPRSLIYRDVCAIGSQIDRLLKQVARHQVHFVFLEDMAKDPVKTYEEIINFLGATKSTIDFSSRNVTRGRRSHAFNLLRRRVDDSNLVAMKLPAFIIRNLNSRLNVSTAPSAIPPSERFMDDVKRSFASEVKLIEHHTQRDLSHWLPNVGDELN